MVDMPRSLTKPRPPQGAHLAALRQAAGLSQSALATRVGESQQNIAFWEQSDKPPRSDVLPRLARVLGNFDTREWPTFDTLTWPTSATEVGDAFRQLWVGNECRLIRAA
jgi:transcriptional regulator with XRE-family HTH domain